MSVAPFPWRSLDSVRRVDLPLLTMMRRAASRVIHMAGAEASLREMLGPCDLSIQLRRVSSSSPRVDDAAVGVLLSPGERADKRRAFAVVIEQALATSLAARVLRRATPRALDTSVRGTPSLAGAMGAILVAAARRNAVSPLRVMSAGPAHTVLGELVALDAMPIGASFTVLLDHDAYLVHAFAPRSALEPLRDSEMTAQDLSALAEMQLEVPLVAAVLSMTAAELAALGPGDALMPIDCNHLELAAACSDVAFSVDVAEGGRLVLRDGPHPLEEDTVDKDALAQSIGETPVVVRVEVGTAQMSAREWANLGAGDVVALGRRIGEHVVLRVGGVEVARGELVDVEGEVGVRIVARAGDTVA